jgi:transposase InsO family protein
MLPILEAVVGALLAALRPRASLVAENLVLRQQLAILRRANPRPRLRPIDRAFWVVVSRVWSRWTDSFVRNHLAGTIAIDFLTVPTVTFDMVYVFFVLSLEPRRVLHVNVTAHPYAAWAAQQIMEAIGAELVPERLIRDRDAIFGTAFDARVDNLGVRQIRITPRSPCQNGYAERWVGTLRRELLDHVIVLGARHLLRLVRQHVAYYNEDRPHMALRGDAPVARAVQPPSAGEVVALPRVGGLHHRYSRAA